MLKWAISVLAPFLVSAAFPPHIGVHCSWMWKLTVTSLTSFLIKTFRIFVGHCRRVFKPAPNVWAFSLLPVPACLLVSVPHCNVFLHLIFCFCCKCTIFTLITLEFFGLMIRLCMCFQGVFLTSFEFTFVTWVFIILWDCILKCWFSLNSLCHWIRSVGSIGSLG